MVFFVIFAVPVFLWFVWKYGWDGERLPPLEPDITIRDERQDSQN